MKKSTKILLGGGLACLIIGFMIVFTTAIIGGREKISQMVTNGDFSIKIGGITLPYMVANNWIGDKDWLYHWNGSDDYIDEHEEIYDELSSQSNGVQNITDMDIEIAGGKLVLKKDEAYEDFEVKIKGTMEYKTTVEDGCLKIQPIESINYVKKGTKITIYMPKDAKLNSFKLEFGGGKADISDIVSDEVDINIGAGELNINKITARELSCDIGAGVLNIKDAIVDDLDMEAAMGKANYAGVINEEAEINCSMGSVDLKIDGKADDFNYDLDCAMGTLNLEGVSKTAGMGTEKVINNGVDKDIEVRCDMGKVAISFR